MTRENPYTEAQIHTLDWTSELKRLAAVCRKIPVVDMGARDAIRAKAAVIEGHIVAQPKFRQVTNDPSTHQIKAQHGAEAARRHCFAMSGGFKTFAELIGE